jgi:acyl-CoA synthetase (AMP-forming)/AMP-acid ligase II
MAPEADYRAAGWWPDKLIPDWFDASLASHPERLAVLDPPNRAALTGDAPRRLSYQDLGSLIESVAFSVIQAGLRRGDVLIVQLPNVVEYPAVYLAAMKLGVILSPVPMQFRQHEIRQAAQLTGAKALLTVANFKGNPHAAELEALAQECGMKLLRVGENQPVLGAAQRAELQAEYARRAPTADDIATICWTSGTEGRPKGVPRTHNHWMAISHAHFYGAGICPGDALLNPFPLVNMGAIGGCFMSWLLAGGTLILHHPMDLPVFLQQIATERPQYTIAPPAVLNALLQNPQLLASTDLSSVRCIGSGAAPLDPAMIRGFKERFGIEIVNMFGSNEGMSLVSGPNEAPDPEQRARLFPRFGRPEIAWPQRVARAIETRLVDPATGREILEPLSPGEMQIRGPTVFDGYYKAPDLTAEAFTSDGYFRTGDLFEIVSDGREPRFYRFVGRLKQVIIRGGFKISPDDIEPLIGAHPDVAEVAVVGYPDKLLGERVCAVIVPKPGKAEISLESMQQHLKSLGVAAIKWPEKLVCIAALPRNPVGKVVRTELATLANG